VAKKREPAAAAVATRLKIPVKRPLKAVPGHLTSRLPMKPAPRLSVQPSAARDITRKAYAGPGKIYARRPGITTPAAVRAGMKKPCAIVIMNASPFGSIGEREAPPAPERPMTSRPPVPAFPREQEEEEELLSIAEIEAREGSGTRRRLKMFLPRDESAPEAAGNTRTHEPEGLPPAYGENALLMIVVDPGLLFVDWEILPETLPAIDAPLVLRIYDVTGNESNESRAHSFIDVGLGSRSGSGYLELEMQGREIVGEIGPVGPGGGLATIIRSERLTIPPLLRYDEFGIVRKLQEAGIPVGY
jgi:hypothetical protein